MIIQTEVKVTKHQSHIVFQQHNDIFVRAHLHSMPLPMQKFSKNVWSSSGSSLGDYVQLVNIVNIDIRRTVLTCLGDEVSFQLYLFAQTIAPKDSNKI